MQRSKIYKYQPLSAKAQTRVIELAPSIDASAPLTCHIQELDVREDDEGYDAISYAWGLPNFSEQLLIDETCILPITPSLRDALVRFRLPFSARRLWADAVCINQGHVQEKSRQVQYMAEIYRRASSVLIWLGNSPSGATCLKMILAASRQQGPRTRPLIRASKVTDNERVVQLLRSLVQIPWFTRRWIIQEAVSSPDAVLYCCAEEMSLARLSRLLAPIKGRSELKPLRALMDLWETWGLQTQSDSACRILQLLSDFSASECAVGHDRIYSLAGLATDIILKAEDAIQTQQDISIEVSYLHSTETVYTDLAVSVMQRHSAADTLQLLSCASARQNSRRSQGSLPSWIPDWRRPALAKPIFDLMCREAAYRPILLVPMVTCSVENHSLAITSYWPRCTIAAMSPPFPSTSNRSDIATWLRDTPVALSLSATDFGAWFILLKPAFQVLHQVAPHIRIEQMLVKTWAAIASNSDLSLVEEAMEGLELAEDSYTKHRRMFSIVSSMKHTIEEPLPPLGPRSLGMGSETMAIGDIVLPFAELYLPQEQSKAAFGLILHESLSSMFDFVGERLLFGIGRAYERGDTREFSIL